MLFYCCLRLQNISCITGYFLVCMILYNLDETKKNIASISVVFMDYQGVNYLTKVCCSRGIKNVYIHIQAALRKRTIQNSKEWRN